MKNKSYKNRFFFILLRLLVFLLFFFSLSSSVSALQSSLAPEIIIPRPGVATTNFEIEFKTQTKTTLSSPVCSHNNSPSDNQEGPLYEEGDLRGELFWLKHNYPDLSVMGRIMAGASEKLLPRILGETLEIRGGNDLSGQAKHHVFGRYQKIVLNSNGEEVVVDVEDSNPLATPTERVFVPSEWSQIIGQGKILGGLFGTTEAPNSVIIEIVNPTNTNAPPRKVNHVPTNIRKEASQANSVIENKNFETKTLLQTLIRTTVSIVRRLIEDALAWIRQEDTEKNLLAQDKLGGLTLVNKTRATVPGLETINQQAELFSVFLPANLVKNQEGKISAPLAVEAQYQVSENYSLREGSEETVFQNLGRTVRNYCLALCSQYPAGYPINRIDPLCVSCNPKDYELTGYGDIALNKHLCNLEGGLCHYYISPFSLADQGCGPNQDPKCTGNRCNPYEIGPDGDYREAGCSMPHGTCYDSSVCYAMTFAPNPAGGFGECQYANPSVCVRADRVQVGECAAVCYWGCCAEQGRR